MINYNYILTIFISYLIGSFSTALVFNKVVNKTDPRETGSKNLGALNTLRITTSKKGKAIGVLGFLFVFLVDAFKGAFSVWLAIALMPHDQLLAAVLASFFVILGHNYSILLKFDGGRGAATFLGILLFLDWRLFLLWLLCVVLFMFIFELFMPVDRKRNFFKRAISDQIAGRLFGEVFALMPFYFLNIFVFWVSLLSTPLILLRHTDRIKKQIKEFKK
ncbi:MAG TPA: glycerol-3-phosphate acyltransferase [Candidatus Pacearchaeota archaeon]|nr:glycerol-3-phosphate acyltransferase [Candidatus Pacearchaeota archaeon]